MASLDFFIGLRKGAIKLREATTLEEQWAALENIDAVLEDHIPPSWSTARPHPALPAMKQAHRVLVYGSESMTKKSYEKTMKKLVPLIDEIFEHENQEYYDNFRDISALLKTEKEPLSKLPADVANKVGSFLTGKEGSLGAQKSQVAVEDLDQPGVKGKGRKTKHRGTRRRGRGARTQKKRR